MGVFTVTCLEKDRSAGRIFFLGLNNSYAYCNPHYASPTFMCYYYTSHEFPMQNLNRLEGKNSYYHPAIISTITCAALMRVRFESVRRSILMAAQKHIFRRIKMPITPLFVNETIKCGYSFS